MAAGTSTNKEVLVGFRRPSPREGYTRIYASLAFRDFCELREADVLELELMDDADPDGPSVVRVAGAAQIDYVKAHRRTGTASFVLGGLRDEYPDLVDPGETPSQHDEPKKNPVTPVFMCSPPITPVLYCVSDVFPPCDVVVKE
jgi:hypothetical protein